MNIQLGDIGHIIQLAIAPVFLLNGVCTALMVLINRLARIIDRARNVEAQARATTDPTPDTGEEAEPAPTISALST